MTDNSMNETKWLIWSIEHDAWWAAESKGYANLACAGVYSYQEALHIVEHANYGLTVDRPKSKMRQRNDKWLNTPQEAMVLLTPEIEKQLIKPRTIKEVV